MAAAGDRTEKPTSKRRDEARKKGQVARSVDLNSVLGLAAAVAVLTAVGPAIVQRLEGALHDGLLRMGDPSVVGFAGLGGLERAALTTVVGALAPLAAVAILAGILATGIQTRLRLSSQAIKPSFAKLNPSAGLKRLVGPQAAVEMVKATVKVVAVGGVVGFVIWGRIHSLAGLVGAPPGQLLPAIGGSVRQIAWAVVGLLLPLGIADWIWQRHRLEKQLRMTKQEVKEEARQADMPPEARGAIKRRQREQARKRMMAAVPLADVVIANPTHFAIALRYDGTRPAPEVVAKGADLVAAEIRRIAGEHGVPIVED
ncbi:MAG: EscU/YscU/HrcU family type III secretion system export apparatus switch protein, partial [Acidobacteriota bacterium]|nr:EscU/YscU/HrcU family type III secretion system export apparatus switch protein [Acidobacteriota bacterium]